MPTKFSREEALRRLAEEGVEGCVQCHLAQQARALMESEHAVLVLTRYPVRWGHLLVIFRRHVTRVGELSASEWADASELARRAAVAVEKALEPARVYVASLGTDAEDVPMSFPHLHFHVLGVPEAGARPREVLTWQFGLYEGEDAEWAALEEALRRAWPA